MDPLIIMKVTERCNLGCKYCILPQDTPGTIMPTEILDLAIKRVVDLADSRLNILFHGGEPLLAGRKYFEAALESERRHNEKGLKINNRIQTNGLLLEPDILEFFEENNIRISLSYDGPKDIHDRNRLSLGGKGTHDKVIDKLKIVKDQTGGKQGVVTVLTKESLGKEEEIYSSLRKVTRRVRLNVYIPAGQGKAKESRLYLSPDEASDSLIKFYELWVNDSESFSLSPFTEIITSMINGFSNVCEHSLRICSETFSINSEGNVFVCGRLSGIDQFLMGNIVDSTLESMLNSEPHLMRLNKAKLILKECGDCEYISICNGGCGAETFALKGSFDKKTHYCRTKLRIYDHIRSHLESFVENETN